MDQTEHDAVRRWVVAYEHAWRSAGTATLGDVFTEDVSYLVSPWAEPVRGLAALARLWEGERAGPDEDFTMTSELVALEGQVAVVRVEVAYTGRTTWRDLWVVVLDADGRCRSFEEWPFAPGQPDGH